MKRCTVCNIPITMTSAGIRLYYNRKQCKDHYQRRGRPTLKYPLQITITLNEDHNWQDVKRLLMEALYSLVKSKAHVADILKSDRTTVMRNLRKIKD